jgi:putative methionine-R-sulfoxide reductase with GAF domain
MELLEQLRSVLSELSLEDDRAVRAKHIAQLIRKSGPYRWVGIYDVDLEHGIVSNVAWDGPNAPAYPAFPTSKGLTSRAIAQKKTVNVGNVADDINYLTALDSTRSEIIVPILNHSDSTDHTDSTVVGTLDVESEQFNAFGASAQSFLEECAQVLKTFWTQRA